MKQRIDPSEKKMKKTILSFLVKLAAAACLVWALGTFVFGIFLVRGEGMAPSFRDGDVAFIVRLGGDLIAGDPVVYNSGKGRQIGRIAARGGDTVGMSGDGALTVNGNIKYPAVYPAGSGSLPGQVPEGCWFVIQDGSGEWAFVTENTLMGRVFLCIRRNNL